MYTDVACFCVEAHVDRFQLVSDYKLDGDQPQAVRALVEGLERGLVHQTLLGATGTGKTFTMANVIATVNRPTLVIAHNKTLAAQLCSEFREFFPHNAVEFFVSYYDYYQPEAYIPRTDTYIEKDAQINDEIDRLRHSATQAVLERRDVIVVASVSCIYGLGSPDEYRKIICSFRRGEMLNRDEVLRRLVDMQFTRNNLELKRGTFRVRGDLLEIQPIDEEVILRIEFFGDEVEKITLVDPVTGEVMGSRDAVTVFPASHYVTSAERLERAIVEIQAEMEAQVALFQKQGKLIEAQRIEQRVKFDIEMMRELGFCSGIENYSRHMDNREPGQPPSSLLDYFPDDYITIIDESHQTIPQIRGMYHGDKARKDVLIDYGFRLPSAADNRPLKFHEWEERRRQVIYVSATPGPYELEHSVEPDPDADDPDAKRPVVVQQIIRPTGLLDPEIIVRKTKGQVDDLIREIRARIEQRERVLVTTLTKRMAEDLTEYLEDLNIKVHYLHSDIKTLDRAEILRDLRRGVYDVVVGINLLREGLDLPEVSLVAILDADKEGFLRSDTSLIQTVGRAARNVKGQVIMYADNITGSMQRAIEETNRRRAIQVEYNKRHGIEPQTVNKAIRDLIQADMVVAEEKAAYRAGPDLTQADRMPLDQIVELIAQMEVQMREAGKALEFERAAQIRDEIAELRRLVPSFAMGGPPVPKKRPARTRRSR
jgi:excinuclease ABC subunit B